LFIVAAVSSVVWLFFKTFAAHKGSACASPI